MSLTRSYTKTIINEEKFTECLVTHDAIKANFLKWGALGSQITIYLDTDYTTQQETDLDTFIAAFVDFTTAESLDVYLEGTVRPFIKRLLLVFQSENMALGITAAGKTAEVLGLFVKAYDYDSNGLPVSLKDCLHNDSLYAAIDVLQHIRDIPTEFTGLSPFITDARLLEMKNKIEVFLGVTPLST